MSTPATSPTCNDPPRVDYAVLRREIQERLGRRPRVLLVAANPNRVAHVPPYGLEVLHGALEKQLDAEVELIDPKHRVGGQLQLTLAVRRFQPDLVGIGFRNLDIGFHADPTSKKLHLESGFPTLARLTGALRAGGHPPERTLIGGLGFSATPEALLRTTGLPYGVVGAGASAVVEFLHASVVGNDPSRIRGMVSIDGDSVRHAPLADPWLDVNTRPVFSDGHRKVLLESKAAFPLRTTSGCGQSCSYCVEGRCQGRPVRDRPLELIEEELRHLQAAGATEVMIADGEFNAPHSTVHEPVLELLCRHNLGWGAYVLPRVPEASVLRLMERGPRGVVTVTVDSAADEVLSLVGRGQTADDVANTLDAYLGAGLIVKATLLFGLPGETAATIDKTRALIAAYPQVAFPYSNIVRLYANTPLAAYANERPQHVYGAPLDTAGLTVYSEPTDPFELTANLEDLFANFDNVVRMW